MAKKKAAKRRTDADRELEAQRGRSLRKPENGFVPFPAPEDVFATAEHSEYLLPAASIDLAIHSPRNADEFDSPCIVHFVLPIEPCDGALAESSEAHHNTWCLSDWMGFQVDEQGRYQFLTDFRYFHRALFTDTPPSDEYLKAEAEELPEHYESARAEFSRRRDYVQQHGWLHHRLDASAEFDESDADCLVSEIGGMSLDANWSGNGWRSTLPIRREPKPEWFPNHTTNEECTPGIVTPCSPEGHAFLFVGSLSLWDYLGDHNGVLLLFYEPVRRIAVEVIDWT